MALTHVLTMVAGVNLTDINTSHIEVQDSEIQEETGAGLSFLDWMNMIEDDTTTPANEHHIV